MQRYFSIHPHLILIGNEKHPNQLLVLNRYENIFILCLYNKKEDGTHEKEFSVSGDSFRKAWDAFIEVTE